MIFTRLDTLSSRFDKKCAYFYVFDIFGNCTYYITTCCMKCIFKVNIVNVFVVDIYCLRTVAGDPNKLQKAWLLVWWIRWGKLVLLWLLRPEQRILHFTMVRGYISECTQWLICLSKGMINSEKALRCISLGTRVLAVSNMTDTFKVRGKDLIYRPWQVLIFHQLLFDRDVNLSE